MRTIPANLKNIMVASALIFATALFCNYPVYGQENTSTNHLRNNINTIKEKLADASTYIEKVSNANSNNEIKINAKELLLVLQEVKNINKNLQTALDEFSTTENKNKSGKYLNSVASDIADLNNKIEYAINKTNKIVGNNDFDGIKYAANTIMTEIKKMENIIPSTIASLELIDQRLTSVE